MSILNNCSISNNTCIELKHYCTTTYNYLYDICNCMRNSKLYTNKCIHSDLYPNIFIIIVSIFMILFVCTFMFLCCIRFYNSYTRNMRIRNISMNNIQNSSTTQNYNDIIIQITQNPPEYDELLMHDSQTQTRPPPYS